MNGSSRQRAVQRAQELWKLQPVFLDTETTGLDPQAEIIEICIIDYDEKVIVDSLVRPYRKVPPDVLQIHRITNEMIKDAPTWTDLWPYIKQILNARIVGIYDLDFYMRLMRQSHQARSMRWDLVNERSFCIMKLYAEYAGLFNWQKIDVAARQCNIPISNTSRARAGASVARAIFKHIMSAPSVTPDPGLSFLD